MAILTSVDSKINVLGFPRLLVFGAPKEGKTIMACTASEKFPREILEGKRPSKHVYLDDMLFCRFDNGGNDSLAEWNISVPEIDLSATYDAAIIPTIENIGETVMHHVKTKGTKAVVLDTFSTMDSILKAYYSKKFAPEGEAGQIRMWGQILSQHLRLVDLMRPVKALVIYNCHSKFNMEGFGAGADAAKKNRQAVGLPTEGGMLVPDISGAAFKIYHGICSGAFPIAKSFKNGKTTRSIYPKGYKGMMGVNRFNTLLDNEEPADFKHLLDKIARKIKEIESDPSSVAVVDDEASSTN